MSEKIESFFITLGGILFYVVAIIGSILPFYAAIVDFKRDELFMAALDIVTVVVGVIRGIMYLFGWL